MIRLDKYVVEQKSALVNVIMSLVPMTFSLEQKVLVIFSINRKLINVVNKEEIIELIILNVTAECYGLAD